MKNYAAILVLSLLSLAMYSCKKKSSVSYTPKLDLLSVSPDSLRSGDPTTQIALQMYIIDGDGDLGNDPNQTEVCDVYIKDARIDSFVGYFFPEIDQEILDMEGGLEGDMLFVLRGDFIYTRDDSVHFTQGDTTTLELSIKDRAGNESNHVTTKEIYIRP